MEVLLQDEGNVGWLLNMPIIYFFPPNFTDTLYFNIVWIIYKKYHMLSDTNSETFTVAKVVLENIKT